MLCRRGQRCDRRPLKVKIDACRRPSPAMIAPALSAAVAERRFQRRFQRRSQRRRCPHPPPPAVPPPPPPPPPPPRRRLLAPPSPPRLRAARPPPPPQPPAPSGRRRTTICSSSGNAAGSLKVGPHFPHFFFYPNQYHVANSVVSFRPSSLSMSLFCCTNYSSSDVFFSSSLKYNELVLSIFTTSKVVPYSTSLKLST